MLPWASRSAAYVPTYCSTKYDFQEAFLLFLRIITLYFMFMCAGRQFLRAEIEF